MLLTIMWPGAHIGFVGTVYTDHPNLQVLSAPLPLSWHKTDTRLQSMAAHHLGALRKAIDSLQKYYEDTFPIQGASHVTWPDLHFPFQPEPHFPFQPDPHFPFKTEYISLATLPASHHFKYVLQEPEKLVFFGMTDDNEHICIKFACSYSMDAHQKCASMECVQLSKAFNLYQVDGLWLSWVCW
jgi:hypothetical protein